MSKSDWLYQEAADQGVFRRLLVYRSAVPVVAALYLGAAFYLTSIAAPDIVHGFL